MKHNKYQYSLSHARAWYRIEGRPELSCVSEPAGPNAQPIPNESCSGHGSLLGRPRYLAGLPFAIHQRLVRGGQRPSAFQIAYQRGRYGNWLRYEGPPAAPLSDADRQWAVEVVGA